MIAAYFAISLAIEKVVSAPRVISNCLPIATTSISLVGLLSRSTMFPASLAAIVPVFIASPTSACGLFLLDVLEFLGGGCFRKEVVHASFDRDRGRRQGVVARDHDGANAHG